MKLSIKTRYALKSLLLLADLSEHEIKSITQLAQEQELSQQYLETIFAMLRRFGIVSSVRGFQGGYALAKPSNQITLFDIITALEGNLSIVEQQDQNDGIRRVLSNVLWSKIDDNIHRYLHSLTLDQLKNDSFDDVMYYI